MSIVNFDENLKEGVSASLFDLTNHLYTSKLSGAVVEDDLAKVVVLEGKLFSNLVSQGKRNEENINDFEKEIPSFDYSTQKHMKEALEIVKEGNTNALMEQERWNKSPIKGLRI